MRACALKNSTEHVAEGCNAPVTTEDALNGYIAAVRIVSCTHQSELSGATLESCTSEEISEDSPVLPYLVEHAQHPCESIKIQVPRKSSM